MKNPMSRAFQSCSWLLKSSEHRYSLKCLDRKLYSGTAAHATLCASSLFRIVSLSVFASIIHARIKGWRKCLSQKLGFLFAFQNDPRNSFAIPNQKEKLAETLEYICRRYREMSRKPGRDGRELHETPCCCNPKFPVSAWTGSWKKCQEKLPAYKSLWQKAALNTADTYARFIYS